MRNCDLGDMDMLQMSDRTNQFRSRFCAELARCLQLGVAAEECFGVIWQETVDCVGALSEMDESRLYWELISWTKDYTKSQVIPRN